jgi:hypothetical protein
VSSLLFLVVHILEPVQLKFTDQNMESFGLCLCMLLLITGISCSEIIGFSFPHHEIYPITPIGEEAPLIGPAGALHGRNFHLTGGFDGYNEYFSHWEFNLFGN